MTHMEENVSGCFFSEHSVQSSSSSRRRAQCSAVSTSWHHLAQSCASWHAELRPRLCG